MRIFTTTICALLVCICANAEGEITVLPEGGETVKYVRSSRSYYPYMGGPLASMDYSSVGKLTFYENGDVYLHNPMNMLEDKCYLKGRKEGSKIIIPLQQPVGELDVEGYKLQLYASRLVYRAEYAAMKPADDQNLVFNILSDGTIKMEGTTASLSSVVMLGAVDSFGIWRFYGEQSMEMVPYNDTYKPVVMPESVVAEDWVMEHEYILDDVKVGFDGNDVYFQNVFADMPGSTIKGRVEGNQVIFDDGQYLGEYMEHFVFGIALYEDTYYDFDEGYWFTDRYRLENLIFAYDKSDNLMYTEDNLLVNSGLETLLEVANIKTPVLKKKLIGAVPGAPVTPEYSAYYPYHYHDDGTGSYGTFIFYFPNYDDNFTKIDKQRLFYQIFFDKETEPYVFKKSEYPGLTKDMYEFPWGFDDNTNFVCRGICEHYIYFYRSQMDRIGVRAVYYGDDDTYYSDIMWSDGASGVEEIAADSMSPVVAEEYYDIAGRRVQNPANGIFIKVEKLANGKTVTTKLVK